MRIASALVALFSVIALTGQAQSPSASVSFRGRVAAADSGAPLRHARIQATTPKQALPPVFTDSDGRFVVSSIVFDASSRLSVSKAGYFPVTLATPRPGADVDVRLPKAGAISGRIIDTLGDPVIGMTVTAEIPAATESERKVVATCQTDDLGEYRLAGLPEGRFFVSLDSIAPLVGEDGSLVGNQELAAILGTRRIAADQLRRPMRMRVYYPGSQSIGDAQPVALSAGEERPTIDFLAPALTPISTVDGIGARVVPRGVSLSAGTGAIRGRVVAIDGRPLSRTIVRLDFEAPDGNFFPAAVTDAEGRYEFQRLGLRTYTITATRAGFLTAAYGQRRPSDSAVPIQMQPGERRDGVDIALSRPSAITGRVVDEAGEPVEGAGVQVLHIQYREGRRQLADAGGQGTHRTDDRGAYRIYGLEPDEYIVSANVGRIVGGQPIADLPGYSTTYAPGTANPGEARIAVDLAQEVSGVEIALVRAPTARISGTIVDAADRPAGDGLILTPSRRSGGLTTDSINARIEPDGRFEFPNVTPGEYVIQASQGADNANDEGESATQFVTVGNADITGVTIRLSRGSTVKGRITLDGRASPESYFGLNLQAMPVDGDRTPQNLEAPASARIQQDGAFDMAGLSGPRVLRLMGAVGDWTLRAVLLNGQDVTDSPLLFGTPNQSIDGLEVVLTDRVSEVTGRTLDARGRDVANATVVVFSTDRTFWGEPSRWGETSRFVASVRAGRDGTFSVRNVARGDYWAAALTQVKPGEWRAPDLLEALIPSATHVAISEGDIVTTDLRAVTR